MNRISDYANRQYQEIYRTIAYEHGSRVVIDALDDILAIDGPRNERGQTVLKDAVASANLTKATRPFERQFNNLNRRASIVYRDGNGKSLDDTSYRKLVKETVKSLKSGLDF